MFLYVYRSTYLYIYRSTYLYIYISIDLHIYVSIDLHIYLSIYLYLSIDLSIDGLMLYRVCTWGFARSSTGPAWQAPRVWCLQRCPGIWCRQSLGDGPWLWKLVFFSIGNTIWYPWKMMTIGYHWIWGYPRKQGQMDRNGWNECSTWIW